MLKLEVKRSDLLKEAQKRKDAQVAAHEKELAKWLKAKEVFALDLVTYYRALAKAYQHHQKQIESMDLASMVNDKGERSGCTLPTGLLPHPKSIGEKPKLDTSRIDSAIKFLTLSTSEKIKTTQCEVDLFFESCCKIRGKR